MIPKESLARNDARADCDYYYSFRKTVQVLAALDFYSDTIDQSMYHDESLSLVGFRGLDPAARVMELKFHLGRP